METHDCYAALVLHDSYFKKTAMYMIPKKENDPGMIIKIYY